MGSKIFVGNLPFKLNREGLKDLFLTYGKITETILIRERKTGKSKGFGFVTFGEENSSENAIAELNKKKILGREIKVDFSTPEEKDE